METVFSPPKISTQVKVLGGLDGLESDTRRKFSMAKKAVHKTEPRVVPRFKEPLQPTFIKQWRKKARKNQAFLAEVLDVSVATISQIENAETGYKQEYLEGIAWALGCTPADLLMRNPDDPEAIWSLWDQAKPAQRQQIIRVIKGLLGTGAA